MTATTASIGDVALRSGLSEATLRYYEQVGLIGPIPRDENGHRCYRDADLQTFEVLACLRATGMGIAEMRAYQTNRMRGRVAAGEQRDLMLTHAARVEEELAVQQVRLTYLLAKADLWDARGNGDTAAEAEATQRVIDAAQTLVVHK